MSNIDHVQSTLLAATSSVAVFTSLLPSFADVRRATKADVSVVNDVRMGEAAATALVVGIGVTASSLAKSPVPAMVSVLSAVIMVGMYESVLTTPPKEVATHG